MGTKGSKPKLKGAPALGSVKGDVGRFVDVFSSCSAPPEGIERGLLGRVTRGVSEEDFSRLSFNENVEKKTSWVMAGDGLRLLLGCNHWEALMRVGKDEEWVRAKLAKGQRFRLAVFQEEGSSAVPATWDGVFEIVRHTARGGALASRPTTLCGLECLCFRTLSFEFCATDSKLKKKVSNVYPELADRLLVHKEALRSTSYEELTKMAGYSFLEVNIAGVSDPRYMTPERYLASDGGLVASRGFLYDTIGCSGLFDGGGRTRSADGTVGCLEYLVPNVEVTQLPSFQYAEMEVAKYAP